MRAVLRFFKALADASRLRLVGLLAGAEHSVDELATLLDLRAPTVSHPLARLRAAGLPERLVIDASHDNSGKDPQRQAAAAQVIGQQVAGGEAAIVGVMLESFLVGGSQDAAEGDLVYGQSITDPCMDWGQTVSVLDGVAAAVRRRRDA